MKTVKQSLQLFIIGVALGLVAYVALDNLLSLLVVAGLLGILYLRHRPQLERALASWRTKHG